MKQEVYSRLEGVLTKGQLLKNEPMKKHTTFRIGGAADCFAAPATKEEVKEIVAVCKEMQVPYYIVGNGSNLLVSDEGYRGVIIQLYKEMSAITVDENVIRAQAGASLAKIANAALDASLTGFEFAAGIPGTVGGACVMNAGAYGGEMSQVVTAVTCMDENGDISTVTEFDFGYRHSTFSDGRRLILSAEFKLEQGDRDAIKARMDELAAQRQAKQPLEYPSAGSMFKRPVGYFAGALVEQAGLKGLTVGGAQVSEKHAGFVINVGGAQVSEKHAGFVINAGGATCSDVLELVHQVQLRVRENFGVELEMEVRVLK